MTRKNSPILIISAVFILVLTSCGTLTPMRYSRGFKSNFEFGLGKKENKLERQVAVKAVKKQPLITGKSENTILTDDVLANKVSDFSVQTVIEKDKTTVPINTRKKKLTLINKRIKSPLVQLNNIVHTTDESRPMEPNVKWAAISFFGGILLTYVIPYASLLTLLGFILAIVGKGKIKQSNYAYSGEGLATAIIIIYILALILTLFYIALLFALII